MLGNIIEDCKALQCLGRQWTGNVRGEEVNVLQLVFDQRLHL